MFALTLLGWLLFRETDLSAIIRDLKLVPWHGSAVDRQVALYLFLLTFFYSMPLWAHSVWVELHRGETAESPPTVWPTMLLRAVACGAAFTAILVLRSRTSLDFIYFQF
jgi:hypothetical protein